MAYPTKYRFLSQSKKGKARPNPIEVSKLTPSELKEYGLLLESETGRKRKGLTRKGKGFMPKIASLSFRRAEGGLIGKNKVMNGYKKGGQV